MARTVLLADDSVTAQNMGRRILMDAGYEVITVNNGSAALKKIHESQPDLIVLDVYMPGYGGLEVCQRLKESEETQKIPVLLTVGKMEPFKADEAKRVRADGHIVKPFEASELLAALTKLEDRIVPQAERSRGRKSKAEKNARFWHAADPVTTYDDSKTESIAYLAEVKERQAQSDEGENPPVAEIDAAGSAPATAPMKAGPQSSLVPQTAAELPVIAEASAVQPEFTNAQSAPGAAVDVRNPGEPVAPVEESQKVGQAERAQGELPRPDSPPATPAQFTAAAAGADVQPGARWVAENVPLKAEEASQSLEQEMLRAQENLSVNRDPSATEMAATSSVAVEPPAESTDKNGQAFAAAAAASSSAVAASAVSEPDAASEAAVAWQNWQQIRDSVMSAQSTEAIANSVAEAAQATNRSPAPPAPIDSPSSTENPANLALEGAALASIVDSVLAELRPKLLEEIAKKLKK